MLMGVWTPHRRTSFYLFVSCFVASNILRVDAYSSTMMIVPILSLVHLLHLSAYLCLLCLCFYPAAFVLPKHTHTQTYATAQTRLPLFPSPAFVLPPSPLDTHTGQHTSSAFGLPCQSCQWKRCMCGSSTRVRAFSCP
jgi:hypothetical protein